MALYVENSLGGFGSFTMKVATGETVTAGQFVKTEGTEITATGTVQDKLLCSPCDANGDESLVVGLALQGGTAGQFVQVATRGMFRIQCGNGAVVAGRGVSLGANPASTGSKIETAAADSREVGIALTAASATNDYVLVLMQLGALGLGAVGDA